MVKKKSSRAITKKTSHNNKIVLVAALFTVIGAIGVLAFLTIATQPPAGSVELSINETTESPTNLVGEAIYSKVCTYSYEEREHYDGDSGTKTQKRKVSSCKSCLWNWCTGVTKKWGEWKDWPYAY